MRQKLHVATTTIAFLLMAPGHSATAQTCDEVVRGCRTALDMYSSNQLCSEALAEVRKYHALCLTGDTTIIDIEKALVQWADKNPREVRETDGTDCMNIALQEAFPCHR
jgi:Rap1a immunity proteins